MKRSLSGKVALVTGAGSGIGRAVALALAKAGARVAVSDIDAKGGRATAAAIAKAGGESLFARADVTRSSQVAALVRKMVARWGRLDVAVNNAGVARGTSIVGCTEADWDLTVGVNLKGVWLSMKHEIPAMLEGGGGAIVNLASVFGLVGHWGGTPYVASKHGVVGLTRTAAIQYAKKGIRVNAVAPGGIRTPMLEEAMSDPGAEAKFAAMHPAGRLGTADEVARAVVWLASDAASFVTGAVLAVDGGFTAQ